VIWYGAPSAADGVVLCTDSAVVLLRTDGAGEFCDGGAIGLCESSVMGLFSPAIAACSCSYSMQLLILDAAAAGGTVKSESSFGPALCADGGSCGAALCADGSGCSAVGWPKSQLSPVSGG
jgi:hypothetical protein